MAHRFKRLPDAGDKNPRWVRPVVLGRLRFGSLALASATPPQDDQFTESILRPPKTLRGRRMRVNPKPEGMFYWPRLSIFEQASGAVVAMGLAKQAVDDGLVGSL